MKNLSEMILGMVPMEKLQDLASELEQRIDRVIDAEKHLMDLFWKTREGILCYIALIASLEEDLHSRVKRLIAEDVEQIYAFHAKLEQDLEFLEQGCSNPLKKDSQF